MMKSLIEWLERLGTLSTEPAERVSLRLFVPGHFVMNFDNWLFTTEQPRAVSTGFRSGFPETVALLACLDKKGFSMNANHRHRFSADLAAALAVALERRIDIPNELPIQIQGQDSMTFLPLGGIPDRSVTGPLPEDAFSLIESLLTQIGGLKDDDDIAALGAAAAMFHGAVQTFETDIRSAYTLAIAGIEILSRQYGQPPTDWVDWPESGDWSTFFAEQTFSDEQAKATREKLMRNQALRLKATFRSYASRRLEDKFWDRPWTEWLYPIQTPPLTVEGPEKIHDCHIRDFLPLDRLALSRSLGLSYDLRSQYVHAGEWFGPLELALNPALVVDLSRPLPFAVLRAMLRELILLELADRTTEGTLPDVKLHRNWTPVPAPTPGENGIQSD